MKGIVAAKGMALATAHILKEPDIVVEKYLVDDSSYELTRLRNAISDCHDQIEQLISENEDSIDAQTVEILDFQLLILEDTDFIKKIETIIIEENLNAEYAVESASNEYIEFLKNLQDNAYLSERASDIADLVYRILSVLMGIQTEEIEPNQPYIAIGVDIAPSLIASLDKGRLKGIILEKGGITSHCVILSRSLGIPCLINTDGILNRIKGGEQVFLDAISGKAFVEPNDECIQSYFEYVAEDAKEKEELKAYIHCDSRTIDGVEVKIFANISTESEAQEAVHSGCEGVGLFRTELLYMAQTHLPPSEEKQYAEYSETARVLGDRPLVIRTLDIGGDKQIGYMKIEEEENPFLGYRAVRYCLDNPEIFKPQIAAILRAGVKGNVWIMFPMITNKTEIQRAKQLVEEVKTELAAQGKQFSTDMKIGMMIETPAAAFDAKMFAKEVDFFSIGTNDLSQYLFAADRTNSRLAYLNSHYQPTLLRMMNQVIKSAKEAGIEVDICGQAAEVDNLVPLWVAMGVDNLSVSIPRIPSVRKRVCELNKLECEVLLNDIMRLDTADEVEHMLDKFIN